ncbi:MAG TPA: GMC family oxidoreductase [Actinomycetota bacterium]|nr:GMC family oxidoreductase [Actinomycetota bacterium]
MFADARSVPTGTKIKADICIIGSGAAGITVAREFIEKGPRVVLLEAGGVDYDAKNQALGAGPIVGLPYFPFVEGHHRQFGGTTVHWGGVCRPLDEYDFEPHYWIPHSGWPIRRKDVDPFYPRAAEICHLTPKEWDPATWMARDRFSPLSVTGVRFESRVAQQVPISLRNFAKVYRSDLAQAPNLHIYLNANVTEIELSETSSTVSLVRVATLSGNRFTVAARLFVLACGGIENPRMLLASRRQRPSGLGNEHDLVGRFFYDHPRFAGGVIVPTNQNLSAGFYIPHRVGKQLVIGYLALSREQQVAERLCDVQIRIDPLYAKPFASAARSLDVGAARALYRSAKGIQPADQPRFPGIEELGRQLLLVGEDLMSWGKVTIPATPIPAPYPEVIARLIGSSDNQRKELIPEVLGDIAGYFYTQVSSNVPLQGLVLSTRIVPAPNPYSRVTLAEDRNELGVPQPQLNWELSPLDKRSVLRTLELLGAEVGRAGLGRLKVLIDDNEYRWPDDLRGGYHEIGTTRMSDSPKHGVVDRNCRVHGISNLYIAGSSVFPTAGSGTPTLTIIALALRLARHLGDILR